LLPNGGQLDAGPERCPACGHVAPKDGSQEEPALDLIVSPPPEEAESILNVSEGSEDGLFAEPAATAPLLAATELPGPATPSETTAELPAPPSGLENPENLPAGMATTWLAFEPPACEGDGAVEVVAAAPLEPQSLARADLPEEQSAGPGEEETFSTLTEEPLPLAATPRPVLQSQHRGLYSALVLVPLISYAVLATIAVLILYFREPPAQVPFEMMPDVDGELKGAKHQKPGPVTTYERIQPDVELPKRLRVGLGETLRIGDVAITPLSVELRHVLFRMPGFPDEQADTASLVLSLRLQNVSTDVLFSPTDPYFERRWKGLPHGSKPYTLLEIGPRRLYGGPIVWDSRKPRAESETVEGQQYRVLEPGQTLTTVVCTDPDDHAADLLAAYHGDLLWRVQVRRGLVKVGEREVSATAVVGVRFRDTDVTKPAA
jgi:hypothetical protein